MPVWRLPSVEYEPIKYLDRWRIIETEHSIITRHVVGASMGEGYVSSPIKDFDELTRCITTRSGRKIHIRKEDCGSNDDAEYVLSTWLRINNLTKYKDVSEEYGISS